MPKGIVNANGTCCSLVRDSDRYLCEPASVGLPFVL